MSDYLQLLRLDLRKLINYIVEIKRTPKKLVSYFLFLAWISLLLFPRLLAKKPQVYQVSKAGVSIILGAYALLIVVLLFLAVWHALKKLSYRFSMGDVNLLFPSPLEPNRILFWSLLKKIPLAFLQSVLPILVLTPTLLNLGLRGTGIVYVYLSVVLFALMISPLSFLIFLLSVRYHKETLLRAAVIGSVVWLAGSWFWQVGQSLTFQSFFTGYQAAGFWNFPLVGWVFQIAYAAFWGVGPSTHAVLAWTVIFLVGVNFLVYRLAKDYYEDVLDYAARMEDVRERKRRGIFNKLEGLPKVPGRRKKVVVRGNYPESKAFLFKEIVQYRRTGFNEYLGYLAPLAVLAGLALGAFRAKSGMPVLSGFLICNGVVVYILLLGGSQGPIGSELGLPYLYILPGTFSRKILAIHLLPTFRFALNMFLLNLSYALVSTVTTVAKPAVPLWSMGIFFALLVASVYFEQGNAIVLSHVLLPSDLDRKIFYPLLILLQILLVLIPAGFVGGTLYAVSQSQVLAAVGIIVAELGMGMLLLFFSDKILPYVEMREFSAE